MQKRAINLTFHGIGEPQRPLESGEGGVWMSRERFLSLLDSVAHRQDVRLTFDDGNASDLHYALPALRARDLKATFFIVAGRLGHPTFLDARGVQELAAAGMQIGSHGLRHRRWRGLDEPQLREELSQARTVLEDVVQQPVTEVSSPFGSYDRRVLRAVRSGGYRRMYTSDRGTTDPGDFLQPRNSVSTRDESDLVGRIEALDGSMTRVLRRRTKLAVKRWR
jgi:peptidoglycan/xylan/chitin deacetylase (PgdA/CDA1 family)